MRPSRPTACSAQKAARSRRRPEAPCQLRRPAPEIGGDSDAVLNELGYSAEEIAGMRAAGVV
jgi:crotonobetainyl-CoA:carnitine CoA-transferase CaiB-like acyl-CoA transferase